MSKVGSDGACSEIGFDPDVGIADVAEMTDRSAFGENGIFHFDCLSDVAVIANGGGAAKVAIGSNLAVFSNDNGSLDEDAGKNFRAFSYDNFGIIAELNRGVTRPVCDLSLIHI